MSADAPVLWSIGYERFPTPQELRDALVHAGIERVIDVRDLPQSRRPGFSRRALEDVLTAAGIVYEHRRELGNPGPIREIFRSGDLQGGREAYRAHLVERAWALEGLADALSERPTAMLCLEEDESLCHRSIIGEELVGRHPEVRIERL